MLCTSMRKNCSLAKNQSILRSTSSRVAPSATLNYVSCMGIRDAACCFAWRITCVRNPEQKAMVSVHCVQPKVFQSMATDCGTDDPGVFLAYMCIYVVEPPSTVHVSKHYNRYQT